MYIKWLDNPVTVTRAFMLMSHEITSSLLVFDLLFLISSHSYSINCSVYLPLSVTCARTASTICYIRNITITTCFPFLLRILDNKRNCENVIFFFFAARVVLVCFLTFPYFYCWFSDSYRFHINEIVNKIVSS